MRGLARILAGIVAAQPPTTAFRDRLTSAGKRRLRPAAKVDGDFSSKGRSSASGTYHAEKPHADAIEAPCRDAMNRHHLRELQDVHTYPCLTITLPMHRTRPDNRQDPVRVKNLVTEGTNRLLGEFSKRKVTPLLDRLNALVAAIDYEYTLDGLVLAVNRDMAREYVLPFTLNGRVVVDDTFFTRDLVHAFNRTQRYWVLSLSEQPTRLYAATREDLKEITTGGFPMRHSGPGGDTVLPGGHGINTSAYRDDRHRQF